MRWVMPLALLSLAASPDARAAVDVRLVADRVSVRVESAPLAEVLDRLSKQLGMKVVYEGAPPRGNVSATLENRTPAQAVLGILEGTGVDYIARMDRTATRVDMLIVSSSGAAAGAPSGAAPRPAPPALGRGAPPAEEEESDDEEEPDEEPPPKRPGAVNPNGNGDPQRPRPGAGPFQGRPLNGPGMPQAPGMPSAPGMQAPGATQQPYPVSPFAPVPPPPTTLPAPPPAAPQGDDSEVE